MTARTYRLEPPDRTGWVLGLGGTQVIAIGITIVVAVLAASAGAPPMALAVICAVGTATGLVRVAGQPALALVPLVARWFESGFRAQREWFAELPLVEDQPAELPPCLAAASVLVVDGSGHGWPGLKVAVAYDARSERYAATLRAGGGSFALAEPSEQERLLELWGDALGAFSREGAPVCSVMWTEWAAPAGMRDHLDWLAERSDVSDGESLAAGNYRRLVEAAGPMGTRHEILITVAVAAERVRRRGDGTRRRVCVDALLSEVRLFAGRLDAAGILVGAPLSLEELSVVLRTRLDPPTTRGTGAAGRSLGELVGVVGSHNGGPLASKIAWDHWRVDGSLHRAFYVADWPRLPIGPTWLAELLLAGDATRTVAVWCEPVPPRTSRRAIERAAAKLDSDEEHRHRTGFRVGAAHRRAQAAVADREAELVSGYSEFRYCGLVVVSAESEASLERTCADMVQRAGATGVDLRALHGRHDRAVAACLPLGRPLTTRVLT